MKKLKLKNLIAISIVSLLTITTILPTGVSAAWKQSNDGTWNYSNESTLATGWQLIDGNWYLFDENGVMKTGWANNSGSWYFLDNSGSMKTGWLNNNGSWYYLDPSSGSMKTGLLQVNNKTYYLNDSGIMKTGNITINGQSYTFDNNGEKISSTTTNSTTSSSTSTSTSDSNSTSSSNSGGSSSSGGSGSSSSSTSNSNFSYKDLFGTWKIAKQINSNKKSQLTSLEIGILLDEEITISKDGISTGYKNLTSPTFSSKTLTASDFAASYPDTFSSLGINSKSIQCVTISGYVDGNTKSGSVLVISNNKLYVYVKDTLFELDRA